MKQAFGVYSEKVMSFVEGQYKKHMPAVEVQYKKLRTKALKVGLPVIPVEEKAVEGFTLVKSKVETVLKRFSK